MRVRCINDKEEWFLNEGEIYEVESESEELDFYKIKGLGIFYRKRFEVVEE